MPQLSELTDHDLMTLYLNGDSAAFEEIYRRYSRKVYHYLTARVRVPSEADEIFQTVFLKFHKSRHSFDSTRELGPWLFTLSLNCIRDWGRKRAHDRLVASALTENEVSTQAGSSAGSVDLSGLSDREKEVLTLRYTEDLPFIRIGEALGATSDSVRQIASRAMAKLRKTLKGGKDLSQTVPPARKSRKG